MAESPERPPRDGREDSRAGPEDRSGEARLVFAAFALLGQVGLTVAAGLAVGMLAGWGLDRWLGTRPAFLIAGMVLGLGGGAVSAGRLLLGYLRKRAR